MVFFEIGRSGGFQESELRARRGGASSVLVNAVAGQFFGQAEFSRNIFQFDLKDVRIDIAWTTCLWTFTLSEIKGGEAGKPFEIYIYLFGIKEPSPF